MMLEDSTTMTSDFFANVDSSPSTTTESVSLNEIQLSTGVNMSEPIQIISTQRGKRKLLFDGYIYRLDRANDRGIEQWRCSKKSCRGRVHLRSSLVFSSGSGTTATTSRTNVTLVSSHSHAAEPAQCEAALVADHIRTSAQHNSHESPKEIVDRLLRSVTNEAAASLPSATAMQRSIQRRRQQQHKSFEPIPTQEVDSVLIYLDNDEHGQNLFHSSNENDIQILYRSIDDRSLLEIAELGHEQILVLTCTNNNHYHNQLAQASIWLCTTFNEVKNDLLHCILTIQIFDPNNETFVSLLYILIPFNSAHFYARLFVELFPIQTTPKHIFTNFDQILIESLNIFYANRSTMPNIKIGSPFLYGELWKYTQHLKRSIDDEEYKSIKYLLALAYIPQPDVIMAFEALQEICSSSMEGIYDKFEDLCIGRLRPNGHRSRPLFSISLWNWFDMISSFENHLTMNTNIKQWDNMFRASMMAVSHRNFYKILRTIQQLYQHQVNIKYRKIDTNKTNALIQTYYTSQFRQIIQSYGSLSFEDYLLNLIQYLPI